MTFTLPNLPYAHDALAPHMSKETLEYHHDKHHAGYVAGLNAALEGTAWADRPVEELLGDTPLRGVDVWEHAYYLRYQHRRADYLEAWWNLVDWQRVAARYATATSRNAGGDHP